MRAVSVHAASQCAYCFEATGDVRARRIPWEPDDDGQWLCADCWRDVQQARRLGA